MWNHQSSISTTQRYMKTRFWKSPEKNQEWVSKIVIPLYCLCPLEHIKLLKIFVLLLLLNPAASVNSIDVGDKTGLSSGLIHVNSRTSLYLSLINPSSDTNVQVFRSLINPPPVKVNYLPEKKLPQITSTNSKENYPYNYFGGNSPVYLLPGSTISYNVTYRYLTIAPGVSTLCPAHLQIGFNVTCLPFSYNNKTLSLSINSTTPGLHSARISTTKNTTLNIQARVKINQLYYDIAGLIHPKECSSLTFKLPQCTVTPIQNGAYVVVFPNSRVKLQNYAMVEPTPSALSIQKTSSSLQQSLNPSVSIIAIGGPTSYAGSKFGVLFVVMVFLALLLFLVLVTAFTACFFVTEQIAVKKSLHEPDKDCLLSATEFTEQLKGNVNFL